MGRSQETFSKKELEKKKQKKKKEKEEKREERRASGSKGTSLDDMIMYVDENGNFTSTPPDPKQKTVVNHEDIQLGATKRESLDDDIERSGVVTFFNESKGYGFIRDKKTQESIFVHVNGLVDPIKENNMVSFEIEMGPKGPNAVNVKKAT